MQRVRKRLFSNFFFFGKQPIENKPYFYLSFPLTKDSFPMTFFFFFLCYQTLENVENYLYKKFSSEKKQSVISLVENHTRQPLVH